MATRRSFRTSPTSRIPTLNRVRHASTSLEQAKTSFALLIRSLHRVSSLNREGQKISHAASQSSKARLDSVAGTVAYKLSKWTRVQGEYEPGLESDWKERTRQRVGEADPAGHSPPACTLCRLTAFQHALELAARPEQAQEGPQDSELDRTKSNASAQLRQLSQAGTLSRQKDELSCVTYGSFDSCCPFAQEFRTTRPILDQGLTTSCWDCLRHPTSSNSTRRLWRKS